MRGQVSVHGCSLGIGLAGHYVYAAGPREQIGAPRCSPMGRRWRTVRPARGSAGAAAGATGWGRVEKEEQAEIVK